LGQKTNPVGNRLGIIRTWESRWFAKKGYSDQLVDDLNLRKMLKKKLYHAGISSVQHLLMLILKPFQSNALLYEAYILK